MQWLLKNGLATIVVLALVAPVTSQPQKQEVYVFVPRSGKKVVFYNYLDNCSWKGTLDKEGAFIPDDGERPKGHSPIHWNWDYQVDAINTPFATRVEVYEYRAGKLFPGWLRGVTKPADLWPTAGLPPAGTFTPNAAGIVLDFKDYKFGPKAVPIYNLPGEFVKKDSGGR